MPPVRPRRLSGPMDEFGADITIVDTRDEDFSIGSAKIMARSIPHRGNTLVSD